MRYHQLFILVCAGALAAAGCGGHQIVRASPPSVLAPQPEEKPVPPETPPPIVVETTPEPPVELPPAAPPPPPARPPAARPRPAPADIPDAAAAQPKPAPPQISPQLSAKDLASAQSNTTSSISTAEKNVQAANGRQLNAAQNDLMGKIKGFLAQAHEAIMADDWIRAQNLSEKARVLSLELVNSF